MKSINFGLSSLDWVWSGCDQAFEKGQFSMEESWFPVQEPSFPIEKCWVYNLTGETVAPSNGRCWGDAGNGVQIGWFVWGQAFMRRKLGLLWAGVVSEVTVSGQRGAPCVDATDGCVGIADAARTPSRSVRGCGGWQPMGVHSNQCQCTRVGWDSSN